MPARTPLAPYRRSIPHSPEETCDESDDLAQSKLRHITQDAGDPAGEVKREELEEQALPPVSHVRPTCHKRESPQELLVSFLQALAESWPRSSPSELPGSGARLELARLIVFLCDEFRRCFVLDRCHLSPFWYLVLKCGAVFTGAIEAQAGCRCGGDGCEHAGDLSQRARNA